MEHLELRWFNYKTETYESLAGTPPIERIGEFLPQNPAAQGLYEVYRALGNAPLEAMRLVLQCVIDAYEGKKGST